MNHVARNITSVAAAALTLVSSASAFAQGEDRPGSEVRPNRGLLITGGAIIAASYIPPVIVAATSERNGDEYLYIPVAGPWIDLGERGGCGPNPCGEEAVYKTLLVATGIAHLVGTGLVVSSFIIPERNERIERTRTVTASTKPVIVPAQLGRSGAGFAVVGRF
jgi:hypothetical protein